ncbi:MAG: helix-turn-helix transcriptional regulator [Clostridia bacterium]|nr:helix-turn-helix transcriptional regulator [Clostridia bacterium]
MIKKFDETGATENANIVENETTSAEGLKSIQKKDGQVKQTCDIKDFFAENLVKYRKSLGLTQADLAEKLNYSDKAVSKWERAESLPDIYTVKNIADFFGVKVDTLITEPKAERPKVNYNLGKKRTVICLLATAVVWLVAIFFFAFINIIFPSIKTTWLSFIYALPVSAIVMLVFTSVWGKSLGNVIIISILIWTALLTAYLTLIFTLVNPPAMLWEIFLIGIPAQGLTIFWYLYKKIK